jgi:threonine dehydrogenase-like Zn-dependent dehydrogenase
MNYMYGQRDAGFFGYSHFTGGFPGGQSEYVRVPKGNVNLLPIPDDVTDEQAIYLSDILPTSYHAVVDTGVHEGDTVAIWGLGPVGMYAARWAQIKGAKRIIGIDRVPERLAMAQNKLGIDIIDFSKVKDVSTEVVKLVPGGVDVCIDAGTFHEPKTLTHKIQKTLMLETDVPETVNEMILATRKMGRIGLIAAYAGFTNGFNIGAVMEKGLRFIGNGQAPVHLYWEEILNDYIRTGKFDPTLYVYQSHRCSEHNADHIEQHPHPPCAHRRHAVALQELRPACCRRRKGIRRDPILEQADTGLPDDHSRGGLGPQGLSVCTTCCASKTSIM